MATRMTFCSLLSIIAKSVVLWLLPCMTFVRLLENHYPYLVTHLVCSIRVYYVYSMQYRLQFIATPNKSIYRIVQNFDGGKFWRFWRFPARPSKFNPSYCLKTIQPLQVCGEKQWPSVKIFSVKYLKSQYPSKFCAIRYIMS